jgi:hypothetical protein
MLAAKLAAAALVSLGLTLLLKKITENVHEVRPAKDEPSEVPQPKLDFPHLKRRAIESARVVLANVLVL